MANHLRRVPPPSSQDYSVIPNPSQNSPPEPSMYNRQYSNSIRRPSQPPARSGSGASRTSNSGVGRGSMAQGIASGTIGGGYGPYSYNPSREGSAYGHGGKFSNAPSEISVDKVAYQRPLIQQNTSTVPPYLWDTKDPDLDDALHSPDPMRDASLNSSFTLFSWRGWTNVTALVVLVCGLIALFAGYPIIAWYRRTQWSNTGFNLGGINGTGQVPEFEGMRALIDPDTPSNVMQRTGTDGKTYNLVFSDEFNVAGRTFWPGDDPFWEAVDLNYWATGDLEWYSPLAVTTSNGSLQITMYEVPNHNLNWRSGMVTSWNKMCFTTGYIEVSVSMPGTPTAPGLWPGAWTMGNLGRAGYGGSTEGTWPYTYDTCDLGTFPNQTAKDGTPAAAATGGTSGGPISYLPGQRLSACTCPGSDHPGPSVSVGRGVPEIDIFETQVDVATFTGQVSQSAQVAPFDYQYNYPTTPPTTTIYDSSQTAWNTYKGGDYQQALSALTNIDSQYYGGNAYAPYGFEWWSDPNDRSAGYVTWFSNGQESWTMTSGSIAADSTTKVSNRLISEEPMYVIFNLGMSPSFQAQDFEHLTFPVTMYVDYIRVYQREGVSNGVSCDPPNYPTADYINNHINVYTDPNITTWSQGGYSFPRNSQYDGC